MMLKGFLWASASVLVTTLLGNGAVGTNTSRLLDQARFDRTRLFVVARATEIESPLTIPE